MWSFLFFILERSLVKMNLIQTMRIIFDIGHPADVHLFKNTIWYCQGRGYPCQIVCRPRDNTMALLKRYGFGFISLGHYDSLWRKFAGIFRIDYQYIQVCKSFKPNLLISFGSPYSSHVSKILKIPHFTFIDTEPDRYSFYYWQYRLLFEPFTDYVFVPKSYNQKFSARKQMPYSGFKELAYLHPNRFKPDSKILEKLNIGLDEKKILVKFAAWDAIHDVHHRGFKNSQDRIKFVRQLQRFGRVFLSSEIEIPELDDLKISLPPGDIHHLLACCDLYVGEGATMASEAGILGVPWVFLYYRSLGYLDYQEKHYGLGKVCFSPEDALIWSEKYLTMPDIKQEWRKKRQRLLEDHIDVTQMLINKIEDHAKTL